MTWKGIKPIVQLMEGNYPKGIKPSDEELEWSQQYWHPLPGLSSWDITIIPNV